LSGSLTEGSLISMVQADSLLGAKHRDASLELQLEKAFDNRSGPRSCLCSS
jgi:hypothetical protein